LTGELQHGAESTSTSSSVTGPQRLTLDRHAAAAALQSLHCLSHIFSWIPLETATAHAPPSLLSKLFDFATFGCRPACGGQTEIGEAAMCCVNELLSRKHVPSLSCEQFILAVFAHTFSLVKSLIHGSDASDNQHLMLVRFDQLTNRSAFLYIDLHQRS